MKQTENYGLNQWELTDRIRMEDFNGDNAKIDAALKAISDTTAAQQGAVTLRNCAVAYGSYTGTGVGGASNPNTLTFDHKPVLVIIRGSATYPVELVMIQGCPHANGIGENSNYINKVTWNGNSVSWYSSNSLTNRDDIQYNTSGTTYYYAALLQVE